MVVTTMMMMMMMVMIVTMIAISGMLRLNPGTCQVSRGASQRSEPSPVSGSRTNPVAGFNKDNRRSTAVVAVRTKPNEAVDNRAGDDEDEDEDKMATATPAIVTKC